MLVGLVVTTVLFFYWGASMDHFLGTLVVSLLTRLNILMIVFGAAFLYTIMEKTGMIHQISHSLDTLHPSKNIRFFLLALCLAAFFEGVAGFGTPGAIVPLLLIGMGFDAVLSVAVVLMFDGLFALFGAVGTPLLTGMQLFKGATSHACRREFPPAGTLHTGPAPQRCCRIPGRSWVRRQHWPATGGAFVSLPATPGP